MFLAFAARRTCGCALTLWLTCARAAAALAVANASITTDDSSVVPGRLGRRAAGWRAITGQCSADSFLRDSSDSTHQPLQLLITNTKVDDGACRIDSVTSKSTLLALQLSQRSSSAAAARS